MSLSARTAWSGARPFDGSQSTNGDAWCSRTFDERWKSDVVVEMGASDSVEEANFVAADVLEDVAQALRNVGKARKPGRIKATTPFKRSQSGCSSARRFSTIAWSSRQSCSCFFRAAYWMSGPLQASHSAQREINSSQGATPVGRTIVREHLGFVEKKLLVLERRRYALAVPGLLLRRQRLLLAFIVVDRGASLLVVRVRLVLEPHVDVVVIDVLEALVAPGSVASQAVAAAKAAGHQRQFNSRRRQTVLITYSYSSQPNEIIFSASLRSGVASEPAGSERRCKRRTSRV